MLKALAYAFWLAGSGVLDFLSLSETSSNEGRRMGV